MKFYGVCISFGFDAIPKHPALVDEANIQNGIRNRAETEVLTEVERVNAMLPGERNVVVAEDSKSPYRVVVESIGVLGVVQISWLKDVKIPDAPQI